jgi:hypothetical protein
VLNIYFRSALLFCITSVLLHLNSSHVFAVDKVRVSPASLSLKKGESKNLTLTGKNLKNAKSALVFLKNSPKRELTTKLTCKGTNRCVVSLTMIGQVATGNFSIKLLDAKKKPIAEGRFKLIPSLGKTASRSNPGLKPASKRTPPSVAKATSAPTSKKTALNADTSRKSSPDSSAASRHLKKGKGKTSTKKASQTKNSQETSSKKSTTSGRTNRNSSGAAAKGKRIGNGSQDRNKTTSLSNAGTISRPKKTKKITADSLKAASAPASKKTPLKAESSRKSSSSVSPASRLLQNAKGSNSTKKASQAKNSKGTASKKSTTSGATKRTSKRRVIGAQSYPREERTKAGTLVIHNKQQEIGEFITEDPELGYVAYTNKSGLLLQRFTKEGLKKIEQQYGKDVADRAKQANQKNGKRLLDRGLALEVDLAALGVDSVKARKAASEYMKDPSNRNSKVVRSKAVVKALNLPKELIGRGWSDKDLVKLASDFAAIGGVNPNRQISPEFFNEWAKVRNKGKKVRNEFIQKWVVSGRLDRENRFKSRDKKKDSKRSKIKTPGRDKGRSGKRVSSGGGGSGGGSTPTGSGSGTGGSGSGSGGSGAPDVAPNPTGVPGPGGGGSGGGSTPTGSGSSPGGPGPGSGGDADQSSKGGRIGYTEISNVQNHSDGSYSYHGEIFNEYGDHIGSRDVTCSAGTCTDTYSNGETGEPYVDDKGEAPQEGPNFEDEDTTGKTMGPGSGPDSKDSAVKAGEVDKQQTKNDQLTNPRRGGVSKRKKSAVVLDPNEDRINVNPDLAGSKAGPPPSNSVSPQEQHINVNPELANPKNPEAGSGKPTDPRLKRDSKSKKKTTRDSKERARQKSQQRQKTPTSNR